MARFANHALTLAAFSAAPVLVSTPAFGLEYAGTVSYSGEYSSNPERAGGDAESDIIHRPGFTVDASHLGARTELDLGYRLHRRIYQDDTFDDESVAEGSASGRWHVLPERLSLFVSNVTRESEISNRAQRVPDNLQTTSHSSAGATLRADVISNHYATVTYEYVDVRAEETEIDSIRHQLQAGYVMPLSPISTLQLLANGTDTNFDEPAAPDYRSGTGSLRYDRQGARTQWGFNVGYTTVDREAGRETVDGVVGGMDITRQISAQTSVGLSYSLDYRDNSLDFSGRGFDSISGDVVVGDTDISEVYEQQTLSLTYDTQLGANRFALNGTATRQDYEDVPEDEDRLGASLAITRALRPNLEGSVNLYFRRTENTDEEREYDEYGASIGAAWNISRRLEIGAMGGYMDRSDEGTVDDSVEEWSVLLRLSYVLFGNVY